MFRKKKISELKLELKQKKIKELVGSMLSNGDVEVYYGPISMEFYIIDRENEVYICISDRSVKLSNHSYLYEVSLPLSIVEGFIKIARQSVQDKVENVKKELIKNEVDLIDKLKKYYEAPKQ